MNAHTDIAAADGASLRRLAPVQPRVYGGVNWRG